MVDNYNRSYLLPLLMKCYARENFTETPVEMVIVDDASDQEDHFTEYLRLGLEIVKPWFKVRAFRIPVSTNFNAGKTLNVAVKQSEGDLLILQPIDMLPFNPKTLSIVHREHEETKMLYLTSRVLIGKNIVERPPLELGEHQFGGASLPKSMFDEMGGFEERLIGYGNVDADFVNRMMYNVPKTWGWTYKHTEELVFIHMDQAKIPIRRDNPMRDEILMDNHRHRRLKVNPEGYGNCNDLEEIEGLNEVI